MMSLRKILKMHLQDFQDVPFPDPPPSDDGYEEYDALRDVDVDVSGIITSVAGGVRNGEGLYFPLSIIESLDRLTHDGDAATREWATGVLGYAQRLAELVTEARAVVATKE